MDKYSKVIATAKAYIEGGIKSKDAKLALGLELEHFVVDSKTLRTAPFFGENGVAAILDEIAPNFEQSARSKGHIIGLGNKDYTISLEPAAQLEISIAPFSDIADIERVYKDFRELIDPVLERRGLALVCLGYHPVSKVDELPLIPKNRYEYMYNHFGATGRFGKNMMKGTAATQVSIDFYSEEDFIRKYKIACRLAPFLSLITDNSPYFEGADNSEYILRTKIWREVDPARTDYCGFVRGRNVSFDTYADFVTASPLVVPFGEGQYVTRSAQELYADKEPTTEEIRHILSMSFPTVRLKTYLEIRYADSLPPELALSYVALIKGLFIDIDPIESYLDSLNIAYGEEIKTAENNIMKDGLNALTFGKKVSDIINDIFAIADSNLQMEEKAYLAPLKELITKENRLPRELVKPLA